MRRGVILAFVVGVVLAVVAAVPLGGAANPTATPTRRASASPQASPVALMGDVEAGKKLSAQCTICHSVNGGVGIGPTWKGLFGSDVELANGTTVKADEAYLTESIKDPAAQVVKGFAAGTMPLYGTVLSDQQIADLVAYIKTL
ncbi:MAG: c-type cytochrome [Thermomicrobiales bacterium]|nr:c-type cytochrome [Thermomicrobiales bacterium]